MGIRRLLKYLIQLENEIALAISDFSAYQYKIGGKLDAIDRRFDRLEDQVDRLTSESSARINWER